MNAAILEGICLNLKGTTTGIKWGNDLCYTVREKMYCVTGLNGPFTVSLKVTPEDFAWLIERDGIRPAPYMARHCWIFVEKPLALTPKEWQLFVEQSYRLVVEKLPAKLKKGLS